MNLPVDYNRTPWQERKAIREEYVKLQEGKCFYCGWQLSGPPPKHILNNEINWSLFPGGDGFLKYPVHLQHSHTSGMTEGAVHAYCNAVMWQYEGR